MSDRRCIRMGRDQSRRELRPSRREFQDGREVFKDPFAIERLDDRGNYGEERFILIGMAEGAVLTIVHTQRAGCFRLISAHVPRSMSKMTTSPKMYKRHLRAMERRKVEAAANKDPDNRPLTTQDLRRMKRTPQVKIIRRALGLSQDEFAARYQIPIGTLRDWEQGRATPDQAARAYLTVIARDPEAVRKALSP